VHFNRCTNKNANCIKLIKLLLCEGITENLFAPSACGLILSRVRGLRLRNTDLTRGWTLGLSTVLQVFGMNQLGIEPFHPALVAVLNQLYHLAGSQQYVLHFFNWMWLALVWKAGNVCMLQFMNGTDIWIKIYKCANHPPYSSSHISSLPARSPERRVAMMGVLNLLFIRQRKRKMRPSWAMAYTTRGMGKRPPIKL